MTKIIYPTFNRDPMLETSGMIIGFYEREFYVFSNFSSFGVDWKGKYWQTSEHAYQAAHFFNSCPRLAEQIHKSRSAHEAYKIAKSNSHLAPKNWHDIKVTIMHDICKHKLDQNEYIKHKLKDTGNLLIVEDSPFDSFWGWGGDRRGQNELGKIWMKLRDKLG